MQIQKKLKGSIGSLFLISPGIILAGYLFTIIGLYFYQEKLIFPGAVNESENVAQLKKEFPDSEVGFHLKDATLKGWHLNKAKYKPLLIYYGGNAEDLSYRALQFSSVKFIQSVFINYRGFGNSEGYPTEDNLYADALEIYDALIEKYEPGRIFLVGRSLGTGVATYIASQRRANALVLITPYDSITAVGQDLYPLMPVNLLIKHRFDSLGRAKTLTMPTLVLLADQDQVVPHEHSKKLIEELPDLKNTVTLRRVNHGDIVTSPDFLSTIIDFLERE